MIVLSHGKVDHLVVLMLENRAFDHMCGYLKRINPEIDGLTGREYNPVDPTVKGSEIVHVSDDAEYVEFDPDHSIPGTAYQTFGYLSKNDTYATDQIPPMNGFVYDGMIRNSSAGRSVMKCFPPEKVPAISTLAREFAIFDRWHASVPGPTEVNRLFVHSATSHGLSHNDNIELVEGVPQKTIYESLDESSVSWKVYMEQATSVFFFNEMRKVKYTTKFRFFNDFEADAKSGKLPSFSFIEPRYATESPTLLANDQHPSHDVAEGEKLIQRVYSILRTSPLWNRTAFLLTYDEHGGFYDHYPIPMTNVPNPDGIIGTNPPFHFNRLGIRVPAILVSPWIPKGYVEHGAKGPTPYSHYEHSSVPATLKKMFNLKDFLTKRDAWAGTFEHLFSLLDSPRTDCPLTLPDTPKHKPSTDLEHMQSITDLQRGMVQLVEAVVSPCITSSPSESGSSPNPTCEFDDKRFSSEQAAGNFMVENMEKFLGRKRGY